MRQLYAVGLEMFARFMLQATVRFVAVRALFAQVPHSLHTSTDCPAACSAAVLLILQGPLQPW